MFLGISEAATALQEALEEGLGPIVMLSDMKVLAENMPFFSMDMLIQLAATIILFIAVRFLFWKPITNILEQRRAAIDKELDDAKELKKEAQELTQSLKSEKEEAKEQIRAMLDAAERDANVKRDAIVDAAKEEARRRLENLEVELEQEKKNMEQDIKKEIVDIAFAAAEKIVAHEIDQAKYLDVVDGILKEAAK